MKRYLTDHSQNCEHGWPSGHEYYGEWCHGGHTALYDTMNIVTGDGRTTPVLIEITFTGHHETEQ